MRILALTLALIGVPFEVQGQKVLSIDDASVPAGGVVSVGVHFETDESLSAWSFGVCHDEQALTIENVIETPALLTLLSGAPPDFHVVEAHPQGWAAAVVVCLVGCASLPVNSDHLLYQGEYRTLGAPGEGTDLEFCGTIGEPPFSVVVVPTGGVSSIPDTLGGTIDFTGPDPRIFELRLQETSALYDPGDGLLEVSQDVLIEEVTPSSPPAPVTAFTLALRSGGVFVTATGIEAGSALLVAGPPELLLIENFPEGIVVEGILATGPGIADVLFPRESTLVTIDWASLPNTLLFNFIGIALELQWDGTFTFPPTNPHIDVEGEFSISSTTDGLLTLLPRQTFLRGDSNDDGAVDIADPLTLLGHLFNGGSLLCHDAADANDDESINIADGIALLGWLFAGDPPPSPPFSNCGFDLEPGLGCLIYNGCP